MAFTFVSGNLALDFAGTVKHRRGDRVDLLRDAADLRRWTVAAGLVTGAPGLGDGDLGGAVALREAIYRAATAALRGTPPAGADREVINAAAAVTPPVPSLPPPVPSPADHAPIERAGDVRAALSLVARAAIDLLGAAAGTIKECEAPTCSRLYVDASRRGGRRWCDMRECGNRAKAAAFRARRHA
jgi:predicted RNA-binding Zn ribbon-like protein